MKDFTRPRGRLRSLPLQARLVYSIFLAFTLAGLALSLWLTEDMVGLGLERLGSYYAGAPDGDTGTAEAAPIGGGGPVLELPDELDTEPAAEPMPLRKLLEVTHFHLFSMPVYLMILSHLFMLSRMGERSKALWIILGSLSVALHMLAPWLARDGGFASTALYALSGTGLLLSFLVMSVIPLWEMWAPPPSAKG